MKARYWSKEYIILSVLLGLLLLVYFVLADAGNYCTTSPCSCGSACQNGGYETSNGYNTIDSCQDGPEDSYEYVHDITITSLNASTYRTGDTVEIDAYVDCDLDGDEISFVYHNGTAWRSFYDVTCSVDGKTHYYRNLTLDNVEGNHSIRVTIAYSGTTGMICAYNHDNIYSDTDDVMFYVETAPDDAEKPSVYDIKPSSGQSYLYVPYLVINISANVTDNNAVQNVSANVSWSTKKQVVPLVNTIGNKYEGNFTNTSDVTTYNVKIIAYDSYGNLNDTETTFFLINTTTNVTITYPVDDMLYSSLNSAVEYEVSEGPEVYSSWVDVNGVNMTGYNKKEAFEQTDNSFEMDNQSINLSQSFNLLQDTYINKIAVMLKKNGTGSNNSRFEIRTDSGGAPSNVILAYADINNSDILTSFAWVNLTLNQTILLSANTSYWLYLKANGTVTDFYSWQSDTDLYPNGNFSLNNSKDLLFRVFDKYRFNLSFTPSQSSEYFQAFANTSQGLVSSLLITANYDFEEPSVNEVNYTPVSQFELDPYTVINVSADVEDNLQLNNVYLQYKQQNDSVWTNKTMVNVSGLFKANFSISDENNVSIQIYVDDTSGNSDTDGPPIIEILYETNWSLNPEQFNTSGALINTNETLNNLSIVSNSDLAFTYNLTSISNREVYFNGSPSLIVNVPANEVRTVLVTATGASTQRTDNVTLIITSLNTSANPQSKEINFSLVTYISGVYLYADIVEYSSSVAQGDHISSLKAKISNVGNASANNLTAIWTVPSDWTSRDDFNSSKSSLSPGGVEVWEFKVSADVPNDASTGTKIVSIYVNSSEGASALDSRSVVVTGNQTPSPSGSPSGGGTTRIVASSGPSISFPLDIYLSMSEIEVPKNKYYEISFVLSNNLSYKTLFNVSLELDGLFRSYYNLSPKLIEVLDKDDIQNITIGFRLPDYYPEGISNINLLLNPSNTDEISKPIKLIVYDTKLALIECLNKSKFILNELENEGIITNELYSVYTSAIQEFNNSNYNLVRDYCNKINNYYIEYISQKENLNLITGKITELESKGYDTKEIKEYFKLLNETFYQGNFDKSSELIKRGEILIAALENLQKPWYQKVFDFYKLNKTFVILTLIIAPLLLFSFARAVYISRTETKIKDLKKEKKKILSLIKELQYNYYKRHMIGKDFYNEYSANYKQRLGEIEVLLVKLKFRKEHYFKITTDKVQLNNQKKAITDLIKSLQTDYYVNKLIDQDSFEKLEKFYNSYLTQIDENLSKFKTEELPKEVDKSEIIDKTDSGISFSVTQEIQPNKIEIETKEVDFAGEINYKDNIKQSVKKTTSVLPEQKTTVPVKPVKLAEKKLMVDKAKPVKPAIKKAVEKAKPIKRLDPKEYFYLNNGFILKSIEELYHTLSLMDKKLYDHHVTKDRNDFANWIYNVFDEKDLGMKIMKAKSKDQMMRLLKKYIKNAKQ